MADFAFAKVTLMLMLAPRMIPQQEHAPAITQMPGSRAARRGRQCPQAARNARSKRTRRALTRPEHSGTLKGVMAAVHSGIRIGCKTGGQCVARTRS